MNGSEPPPRQQPDPNATASNGRPQRLKIKRSHSRDDATQRIKCEDRSPALAESDTSDTDDQEVQFLETKRLRTGHESARPQIGEEHSRSNSSSPGSVVLIKEVASCVGSHGNSSGGSSGSSGGLDGPRGSSAIQYHTVTSYEESSDSEDDCMYGLGMEPKLGRLSGPEGGTMDSVVNRVGLCF